MAEYTITIDGHESAWTEKAVEQTFREMYGGPDVTVTVEENEA